MFQRSTFTLQILIKFYELQYDQYEQIKDLLKQF